MRQLRLPFWVFAAALCFVFSGCGKDETEIRLNEVRWRIEEDIPLQSGWQFFTESSSDANQNQYSTIAQFTNGAIQLISTQIHSCGDAYAFRPFTLKTDPGGQLYYQRFYIMMRKSSRTVSSTTTLSVVHQGKVYQIVFPDLPPSQQVIFEISPKGAEATLFDSQEKLETRILNSGGFPHSADGIWLHALGCGPQINNVAHIELSAIQLSLPYFKSFE